MCTNRVRPCALDRWGVFPGDHLGKTSHCALDALFNMFLTHAAKQAEPQSKRKGPHRALPKCLRISDRELKADRKKKPHTVQCCTLPAASCVSMRREVGARAPASYVMKLLFGAGGSEIPSQARSAKQHSCLDYRSARVEIQCLGTPPLETSSTGRAWERTLWSRRVQPGTPQCLLENSSCRESPLLS